MESAPPYTWAQLFNYLLGYDLHSSRVLFTQDKVEEGIVFILLEVPGELSLPLTNDERHSQRSLPPSPPRKHCFSGAITRGSRQYHTFLPDTLTDST